MLEHRKSDLFGSAKTVSCLLAVMLGLLAIASSAFGAGTGKRRVIDDPRQARRLEVPRPAEVREPSGSWVGTAGTAMPEGVAWLHENQNVTGSWGAAFEFPDTTTVLDILGRSHPLSGSYAGGVNWLTGQLAADNDELSRKILALELVEEFDSDDLVDRLIDDRNPAITNPGAPNFPEGGWGFDSGFETDSLTTALALLALEATGRKAGIGEVGEPLAPGGTNVHEWEIAVDALTARIRISVAGSGVRLRMTQGAPPTGGEPFFTLPAGGTFSIVFPDSGLPFTPGTNFISIESTGPAATYSFTASYQTADFDTRAFADALDYLRQAQNGDGGWGIQIGDATTLYTTVHVMLALQQYRSYDFDTEIGNGVGYLLAEQLIDGSFGVSGTPIPYLTALATLNLIRFDVCPFSSATEDAINALLGQQVPDGSWAEEPYDTALALRALWEYDSDGDGVFADGDCSGIAGDNPCTEGVTTGCDDNCADYSNSGQGGVVFGQDIVAPDEASFSWSAPVDVAFVKGDLSEVGTYGVIAGGAVAFATSLSTLDDNPAPGDGLYYLLRLAGDCMTQSWQTSLGSEPGRDQASLGEVEIRITDPADGAVLTVSPAAVSGTVDGADPINVTVNGIGATVDDGSFDAAVTLARGANTITAMATDAAGFMGTDQIAVTLVDHSIPIGGMATGSRTFSADSAVLDQIAFYTESQIGVPPGVFYSTLSVSRIAATVMEIGFQIDVTGGAAPGVHSFQVEYGLLDSSMDPLGPLTGNVFDFAIEVAP